MVRTRGPSDTPPLADVVQTARLYGTSLVATARRWTELSAAPCALLESKDGKVTRVDKTPAFRADVARGRSYDDALAAIRGASVEHAEVPETGALLTWVWHGPGWERPGRSARPRGVGHVDSKQRRVRAADDSIDSKAPRMDARASLEP